MDLIQMTRELGAQLQKDERYEALTKANAANEADEALNQLIGEIRLVQMSYQKEASKPDADEDKLKVYDTRFNELYTKVMDNPNMQNFQQARHDMDELMKYITGILTLCVRGEDPATCEPEPEHACGGECGSCGSDCH